MKTQPASWSLIYLCVGLTSLSTLLFELSLTRIFSVVFYYHFAFLAISIALFGLGVGGVLSYVVAGWRAPLPYKLGGLSLANTCLIAIALAVILAQGNRISPWDYVLIYFTTSLPFIASGTILSLAVSETIERVNRVYFFDLLGAACGCMLLWPLLELLDGPSAVISSGAIFAAAGAIWFTLAGSLRGRVISVAAALSMVAFLTYNKHHDLIGIHHAKEHTLANETFVKWNSFSRIAIEHDPGNEKEKRPPSDSIRIDADAQTGIFAFDLAHLTPEQRDRVSLDGPALPYAIRPGAKALIIGPGGGWDVARALATGSRDITAVEINPIIARTIMQEKFPQLSAGIYLRPDVHVAGGRWPQLRAPQPEPLPGDTSDPRGYLGFHRCRRLRTDGEQPLHERCRARLPFPPHRRWNGGVHALGFRSAARIAAPGFAGDQRFRRDGRGGRGRARDRGSEGLGTGMGRAGYGA